MAKKKERKVDYTAEALLGTIGIALLSLLLLFAANSIFPFRRQSVDENIFFLFGNFFSLATFVLSLYLTFIYLKDYLELRSRFTLGVLLVIISLMMFALTSNPFIHVIFAVYGIRGIFPMVPYLFATIALAILAWISSS
ncbi:MAG: hypothetical protein QXF56_02300 [Candidatus Micrarchaeia archaeon]